MKKIIFISLLILMSCNEQELKDYGVLRVQGVDRYGQSRVCYRNENEICTDIADIDEEHFARNCESAGNKAHKCSCHEYVCEVASFTGIDVKGNTRTCTEMTEDNICTMEFTESDQYALDCEEEGKLAVQCGCHDYICVDNEKNFQDIAPVESKEYYGTNAEGVYRACRPMDQDKQCDVQLDHVQIYAQNCRAEGHEVVWCSCAEVLCLDQ
jgi:hypothetical protein